MYGSRRLNGKIDSLAAQQTVNTVFLLHMNGADDGTVFTDEMGVTFSQYHNAVTKTGVKKFGTASAYFDGVNDAVQTGTSAINWNTLSAWTFECFAYFTNHATQNLSICAATSDFYWGLILNDDGAEKLSFLVSSNGSSWDVTGTTPQGVKTNWANDTWYHLAVVYNGTNYKVFVDGVLDFTVASATKVVNAAIGFRIGLWGDEALDMLGYIDEVRVSNIARYTSDFTAPTAEFGVD